MVPIPQEDAFGNRILVPAQFRIDEELLREMAQTGHGRYFHASDSEGLAQVYGVIDAHNATRRANLYADSRNGATLLGLRVAVR